jgi:uncharacterized protein YbjT (DUF2867 family)
MAIRTPSTWPARTELPAHEVHALTTTREHLPRKTRAFIEYFRGRLGDPPYWERGLAGPDAGDEGKRCQTSYPRT